MNSDLKRSWELLAPHVRPRIGQLGLSILFGTITAFAQAGVLLLFIPIWNEVLFPAKEVVPATDTAAVDGAAILDAAGATEASSSFTTWMVGRFDAFSGMALERGWFEDERLAVLALLIAIAVVMGLIAGASQYGFTWVSRRLSFGLIVDLRVRLARHLMGLSVRYHSQRRFGDLLSRVSSDVTTTLSAINIGLKNMLQEPLMALATLVIAATAAPLPTLGMVLLLPIAALPISRLTRRVRRGSRKSMTSLGESVQALSQMFQGIRIVKAFGGEERELDRYRDINKTYLKTSMKMVRAVALTHAWTALYSILGVAVLAGGMGYLNIRYPLFQGGGDMIAFFLAIARLNNHIKIFAKGLTKLEESIGSSVRIQELLEEQVDVREVAQPLPIAGLGAGVVFEDVTFRYPESDVDALQSVQLDVQPGQTLALVGASGAGKSTLMDLVARFIDPTGGRILVDGKPLAELSLSGWTSLYAMVGQVPFLFHASIEENIRYGRPGATRAEVEEAARAANIDEFIRTLPNGYDTDVADMGARLSGGQRQRITIARALLKGAPLLLLDEATSALDSESEAEVQRALERLMEDRTVIVIAHRLATVRDADRIAVLDDGRLVELGRHDELVALGGVYARLYDLQNLGATTEATRETGAEAGC